jgi:hypothetical protein
MKLSAKLLFSSWFVSLGIIAIPAYADVNSDVKTLQDQQEQGAQAPTPVPLHPTTQHHAKAKHHKFTTAVAPSAPMPAAVASSAPAPAKGYNLTDKAPTFVNAYVGNPQSFPIDLGVPGRSFVSTGPYIGVPLVYSGSNLIINSPSVNEDVTLLNMRKAIHARMEALGRPYEDEFAHLLLSGILEGQVYYQDPGVGPTSSNINLSTAELDGYLLGPSHWLSGLFAFAYDDSTGPSEGSLNNNSPTQNSRLFLSKAFITIGNFTDSPLYGTIGQLYVPFGTYSSNMVSNPLTKTLGRIKARAIVMGFQQRGDDALYASGFIFQGDTHVGATSRINNGGFNVGYRFNAGKISGDFGGGGIVNIADSVGMQNNGNSSPLFGGFGAVNNGNETIAHRVAGLDLRALFSVADNWDFLGEYIGSIGSFSMNDLTYNSHGARPQAVNAEIAYTFTAFTKPTSFAFAFGKSWNALALELAAQRFSVVLNTSWWKDTLESLELRHDQNYAASDFATGTSSNPTTPIFGTGKPDNIVTAQFDIYF